ncbi:MAG: Fur family transcriptional regulator [Oscillospiraceae bacterium]
MSYQTHQKTALLKFFEDNPKRQYTIDELIGQMGEDAPAKSTAYRIVKKLADEGLVRRFVREGTAGAVYQLAGKSCCAEHLHIKCLDCGLLIHLDSSAQEELTKSTGFVLDDERSMLYGRCAQCAGRAK